MFAERVTMLPAEISTALALDPRVGVSAISSFEVVYLLDFFPRTGFPAPLCR